MTILEAPPAALLGRASHRLPLRAGAARWVMTRGWVHLLLLIAMSGCLYPFLWMFVTSVKTDEELAEGDALPVVPVFRDHSPYVRGAPKLIAPDEVSPERFRAVLPKLRDAAFALARAALPPSPPEGVDADQWASSSADALLSRSIAQLGKQSWNDTDRAIVEKVGAFLTPDVVEAAVSDQLSRLQLSAISLTTLDGRTFTLTQGGDAASWQVGASRAAVVSVGDSVRIDYRFGSGGDAPIVLTHDFDLPAGVDASDIHKIVVPIRADNSWHGFDAALDMGGIHWRSARTTYLVQNRGQSLSFQPPTFDDTTVRARTWIALRAAGSSDRTRRARLSLYLSPSSPLRAIFAKVARNYLRAFDSVPFLQYVGNSLLLVGLTIGGALFSSAFVAYAFARLHWPGRGFALILLLSTMMVPAQVTMIPSFLVWRGLGWYNTLNPMWVPAWFGNAFFIFLMIQHMKTIPRELEEAARIDGLGVLQTWWYVIVPQLKPSLAAIAVLSFLGAWNEFMGPLIYLRDQSKFPLSLGLFGMRVDHGADWSMLMAANMLMTIPSIIVFFRFQRYFIEGMTVTGMKG
jgi:multiple sugar transport system permease protein